MKLFICLILSAVIAAAAVLIVCIPASAVTGDVNGDGGIDNKDVVVLFRYVSAGVKADDESVYDFNRDGNVDNKDVVALFRAVSSGYIPPETEETTSGDEKKDGELVIWRLGDSRCSSVVVYDKKVENPLTAEATYLTYLIKRRTGAIISTANSSRVSENEIILSSKARPETAEMLEGLNEGEYAVRVIPGESEGGGKLLIATTTYRSAYDCVKYLVDTYFDSKKGLCIPYDLNITGTEEGYTLIESNIKKLRDPCVLVEDGVCYAYGTGWKCYKNVSGDLSKSWKKLDIEVVMAHPETDGGKHWAPEVHKYNGAYYMFTTYESSVTAHRGCIILKSDSPEGPFVEITDGFITPSDWDAIDGTFYVDPDGQPWMVFVHEWTSMPNNVGAFAAAKLSDDLTHFISEPIELFKANAPKWANATITDGCWMYTTKDGDLLLLWSNFDAFGYCVGVARSSNGRLDGRWKQETDPFYSKCMTGEYDGGHGMIFTGPDGNMYLSIHSPNTATDDRSEKPVFLQIEEKDGKLVWAAPEETE